jgi:hypothetical protein
MDLELAGKTASVTGQGIGRAPAGAVDACLSARAQSF